MEINIHPRNLATVLARGKTLSVILVAGLSCFSASAWAQASLVQATPCGGQVFPTATCTIPATGTGHLIVVGWASVWGTTPTTVSITDNAGNNYVQAGNARSVDATSDMLDIWYAKNSIQGATTLTITPSVSGTGAAMIWEFSGLDPVSPLDQTAILNSQGATTTPSGASVTTNLPNAVVISIMAPGGSVSGLHAGNSFTNDSINFGTAWAHLFTSSPGTYAAQWDTTSGTYASSTVSFKAASGSPCDLTSDGTVNILDVQLGVNMSLVPPLATCTANINGAGVCNQTTVQRVATAALGGACVVDAPAVTPTLLSCNPSSVNAPGTSACTVTLSGAAPTGGLTVSLSSNNANATVPTSITANSGASTVGFTATVASVSADQSAILTASANGTSKTSTLNLLGPAQLSGVSCSPSTLLSLQAATCTVTLTKVPTGTATVSLSSSLGLLTVPLSMTITGSSTGTFTATAGLITSLLTPTITASWNGVTKTATLNLSTTVSHNVSLTWVASTSTGVTGYNIYRATASGAYATPLASVGNVTSYTDNSVQAGQTYFYVVRATNGTSESINSNESQAAVPTP